jgi:hypothetical protein
LLRPVSTGEGNGLNRPWEKDGKASGWALTPLHKPSAERNNHVAGSGRDGGEREGEICVKKIGVRVAVMASSAMTLLLSGGAFLIKK